MTETGRGEAPESSRRHSRHSRDSRDSRRRRHSRGAYGLRVVAISYVAVLVIVPLGVVVYRTFKPGMGPLLNLFDDPQTVHALELSAEVAVAAVVLNTVFGVGMALLLTRSEFRGRGLLNALVDLPVSVSPIVVGLALVLVYGGQGWFAPVLHHAGLQVIDSTPGIVMATVFVSMPLVVRSVAPVLVEAGTDAEQAAASLGAGALTQFRRITFPVIRSAMAYGVVLGLARCLGEYGAVLVVSGNVEGRTETATLRISNLYDADFQPNQAYALTFLLLVITLTAIVVITTLRRRSETAGPTKRPPMERAGVA